MAGRNRKSIHVITGENNRRRLSKEEIKKRFEAEAAARGNTDRIIAPEWLNDQQQHDFYEIATELLRLDLMSNLDCDTLAMYIDLKARYTAITNALNGITIMKIDKKTGEISDSVNTNYSRLQRVQLEVATKVHSLAGSMGLTLNSRLKLVVPKQEDKPKSKWDEFGA